MKVVVGTAIIRGQLVLAQQRSFPADCAGRWEFPGGRVESGEAEPDAVVRECREELGVEVTPGRMIGHDLPLANGMVLRVYTATLLEPTAEPAAVEHRTVRWVGVEQLDELHWLDADLALLPDLRVVLRQAGPLQPG